ncbi:MAG TPA: hypothetical protein VL461_06265 [Dictyobacter sp.]|jgi:hypothetical protein|nr:hypothetical protein [Dictyobacter sp.]
MEDIDLKRVIDVTILAHLVVTSVSGKKLRSAELSAFINDLLRTGTFLLPAAILVGQARALPHYWGVTDGSYITPNAPGLMLDVGDADFHQELIWYYGIDEAAFQVALSHIPFEEQDCCISFPFTDGWNGWDGAVIYVLKQPFFLDIRGYGNTSIRHCVTSFFTLFSAIGGGLGIQDTLLQPIITRYFGPDEAIDL